MSSRRQKQKKTKTGNPLVRETLKAKGHCARRTRRKWMFRLAAVFVIPALFFAVLEGGLRLGGYGYPTGFFLGPDAEGTYATNPQFGWRFFPRALARKPDQCFIAAKSAATIRIFVLGGSAAQGIPEPSLSFGRILDGMLSECYPDVKFEVVNVAMTAINSHVTRETARDCATHEPDLFIVYLGNNEVVGPYGPGTVFQNWSPSLNFIRTNIWLKSTRTGQLLGNVMRHFRSTNDVGSWQGMEMFLHSRVAADDARLAAVYGNFQRNLRDICGIAQRRGPA